MEKSCGVVLLNSDKVLVLQYAAGQKEGYLDLKGHWDFPKGHVDEGETEIETATRELVEETGISDVVFLEEFRKTINYTFQRGNRKIGKEVVFFIAKTIEKEVNLSHEHVDYEWLDFKSALKRLTYENARSVLKEAIDFYVAKSIKKFVKFEKKSTILNLTEFSKEPQEVRFRIINDIVKKRSNSYYPPKSKKVLNLISRFENRNVTKCTLGGCIFERKKSFLYVSKEF